MFEGMEMRDLPGKRTLSAEPDIADRTATGMRRDSNPQFGLETMLLDIMYSASMSYGR